MNIPLVKSKFFLLIASVIFFIVLFLPNFSRLTQLNEEKRDLQRQITKLKDINLGLKERIDRLENDPVFLERVAREKLKQSKEGEIIYRTK